MWKKIEDKPRTMFNTPRVYENSTCTYLCRRKVKTIITRNVFYMSDEMFFTAAGPNLIALLSNCVYTKTDRPRYLHFLGDIIWVGIEKTLLVWKLFRSGVPITITGDKIFLFFCLFRTAWCDTTIEILMRFLSLGTHWHRCMYVCVQNGPYRNIKYHRYVCSGGLIPGKKMRSAFTKSAVKYYRHWSRDIRSSRYLYFLDWIMLNVINVSTLFCISIQS